MRTTAQVIQPDFAAARWGSLPVAQVTRSQGDPLGRLDPVTRVVSLAADEELFAQGSPVRYCYRVESGCVRSVRLLEDGRRLIDRFLLPGDLLAFDAGDRHDVSAEAVGCATLSRYPIQAITDLAARDVTFARYLWSTTAGEVRAAHRHGLLLGRKTAVERVASFLRELAHRIPTEGTDHTLALPMGRADIADHLGLTVETVSRTLTQLRLDGHITVQQGSIGIRNAASLADLTGDTELPSRAAQRRSLTQH